MHHRWRLNDSSLLRHRCANVLRYLQELDSKKYEAADATYAKQLDFFSRETIDGLRVQSRWSDIVRIAFWEDTFEKNIEGLLSLPAPTTGLTFSPYVRAALTYLGAQHHMSSHQKADLWMALAGALESSRASFWRQRALKGSDGSYYFQGDDVDFNASVKTVAIAPDGLLYKGEILPLRPTRTFDHRIIGDFESLNLTWSQFQDFSKSKIFNINPSER